MTVELNHTVVAARDREVSARFLADILGLRVGAPAEPFLPVLLDNGVTLDFATAQGEIVTQHLAFLVSADEFDSSVARIQARGLEFWADPHGQRPGEIDVRPDGRTVYFFDPDRHALEIISRL